MKTPHLSIIVGSGIAVVISFALIVVIIPASLADQAGLTIGTEQNEVGVGEPISFFVEISNPLQDSVFPTAVIVNEQNQTIWHDDDLPPNGYKGITKEYYVQKDSENVPIINQTGKYTLIVTFTDKRASKDLTVTELIRENNMLHYYGTYKGIDEENTSTEIANQTYYLTTIHKTPSDMIAPNDTTVKFDDVAFTFPGCGQCLPIPTVENPPYYVNVQFKDKTNETLEIRNNQWSTISPPIDFHEYFDNGTKIFPNGTRGTWTPRFHMDPIVTVLSNHEHPQAGITVTHDSMKFLVSTENSSSQQFVPLGNTVNSTASENQSVIKIPPKILSPLKQFKSGIPISNIQCAQDFLLVIKTEDGTPACVTSTTAQKLVERGWTKEVVANNSKITHMDLKAYGFVCCGLDGDFLKGNLSSNTGPISDANVTISINGIMMGYAKTYPDGCFQFNQWNDSKLSEQTNAFLANEKNSGVFVPFNLAFSANYAGDDNNHYPTSANATSSMSLIALPLPPPQFETTVTPSQVNVTQGTSANLQISVKPMVEQWDVTQMNLYLEGLPCGVSYQVSQASDNNTSSTTHPAVFDISLNTTTYSPEGMYFVHMVQNGTNSQVDHDIGTFSLNILKMR